VNLKHQIDDACVWRMVADFVETAAAEKIRRPSFPQSLRVRF
jgi:hypothetical protein